MYARGQEGQGQDLDLGLICISTIFVFGFEANLRDLLSLINLNPPLNRYITHELIPFLCPRTPPLPTGCPKKKVD